MAADKWPLTSLIPRCDACGQPLDMSPSASDQRGGSVVGVYTMHGGTRLDEDDRHNLVHTHHFSEVQPRLGGDEGLQWMVAGSFGQGMDAAGALPGQKIHKANCDACVDLEATLRKGKSSSMRESEYKRYLALGKEALRMRRESQNLDLVVARQREQLLALQSQLDEMMVGVREIERLFEAMSTMVVDGQGCNILFDEEEGPAIGEQLG